MRINSRRLVLTDFQLSDQAALHRLYMMPETVRYNPGGFPENESATKNLVTEWAAQLERPHRKSYTMLISDRKDQDFIGVISLEQGKKKYRNAEVWYKLSPEKWGLGFATESLITIFEIWF